MDDVPVFPLGTCLWGFQPADCAQDPQERAPDAWLLQLPGPPFWLRGFIINPGLFTAGANAQCVSMCAYKPENKHQTTSEHCAGSDFSSCAMSLAAGRAGRDYVLSTASMMTLQLDLGTAGSSEAWEQRLAVLERDLLTRGEPGAEIFRVTTLKLVVTQEQSTSPAFQRIPSFLATAGKAFTSLEISSPAGSAPPTPAVLSAFLQQAAPGLPNLRRLAILCGACTLPPPSCYPKLQSVRMDVGLDDAGNTAEVLAGLVPYLQQIEHLGLGLTAPAGPGRDSFPWHLLFTPSAAAAGITLASLTTEYDLTDNLLQLLQQRVPSLEELLVGRLAIQGDFSDKEWGVCELEVSRGVFERGSDRVHAELHLPTLVCLPKSEEGCGLFVSGPKGDLDIPVTSSEVGCAHTHICTHRRLLAEVQVGSKHDFGYRSVLCVLCQHLHKPSVKAA